MKLVQWNDYFVSIGGTDGTVHGHQNISSHRAEFVPWGHQLISKIKSCWVWFTYNNINIFISNGVMMQQQDIHIPVSIQTEYWFQFW